MKRRSFITRMAALGAGVTLLPQSGHSFFNNEKKAGLAFIGVGMRGAGLLLETVKQGNSNIVAVADIDPKAIDNIRKIMKDHGLKDPQYYPGEKDFEKIVQRDDVEAVIISTPWQWHLPMSVASMKAGKYTGCEVLSGLTVQEIREIVDVQEKTGAQYMMLENVCYRRDVMAVLNMARKGMFGQITYAECGYQHDLREVLFNNGIDMIGGGVEFGEKGTNEARWRTQHYIDRNGDLYPTHGIGPVANLLNITRGNQFTQMVSMASPAASLHHYIVQKGGAGHPNAKVKFKCGDVITSLIQCANGEMIKMTFDTSSPRPYGLGFRVQGTEGIWTDDAQGIYIQHRSPKPHEYEPVEKYIREFDHPYWSKYASVANSSGHGGMDYFIIREFVDCVLHRKPLSMDVYDAAMWSVLSPLSEKSVEQKSKPVLIPDFTRGKWKERKPVFGTAEDFSE